MLDEVCKDVAIVIVNYNGISDTVECINSILNAKIESLIIVVDNASDKDEAREIQGLFPLVKIIKSDINGGFSYGNNLGIKTAIELGYSYIMLLNNDTVIDKNMVYSLRNNCSDENISVPKMLYYGKPNVIWYGGGRVNKRTGNAIHINQGEIDVDRNEGFFCSFASGCCLMVKANVIKDVGLLNESYFMYCEDTEFSIRIRKKGYGIKYVPDAILWHKVSATVGGCETPLNVYYTSRNRLMYIYDNKEYFESYASIFTVVSRIIRAFQYLLMGKKVWRFFLRGVYDYYRGISGEVSLLQKHKYNRLL